MGAERLVSLTQGLQQRGECAVAPYVTAGDGGLQRTLGVLRALESAGAGCIELGIPFSDPIADGPVLQAAAQRALEAGTTFGGILELIRASRAQGGRMPILAFSYANPLYCRGIEAACEALAEAGADGLLVPDLPVEESALISKAAAESDLAPVFFATPTTSRARLEQAASASRGFLYVIGRTGITGARTELGDDAQRFLQRVRAATDMPLGVGFGLAEPAQVRAVAQEAQLAIVGSALVAHIHRESVDSPQPDAAAAEAAAQFVAHLCTGLNR